MRMHVGGEAAQNGDALTMRLRCAVVNLASPAVWRVRQTQINKKRWVVYLLHRGRGQPRERSAM